MGERAVVEQFVMEAATGRAFPVGRGQVIRVRQVGNGQCLDFNAFNLNDCKETFHCGRTRTSHGLNPGKGSHLWSAPPHERPMLTLIEDTVEANDVNFPRCSAFLYETRFGFHDHPPHSNCQDILAEAIREYGLVPEDVHDSFNGFMRTGVAAGELYIGQQLARQGDYLEFLAHFDILAVTACCGADLMPTSNYELKGLEVTVLEGDAYDHERLLTPVHRYQRSPAAEPARDRALRRDATYEPQWPWLPAVKRRHKHRVRLTAREADQLASLRRDRAFEAFTDEEIVRYAFLDWYLNTHAD